MNIDENALYTYNLTLQPPTTTPHSAVGLFRGIKASTELVTASKSHISLYTIDSATGKLVLLSQQLVFGTLFRIDKIRLPGQTNDLLVATSDSGNLSFLAFSDQSNTFGSVAQLPLAKTGFSRFSPGEYLAVDPSNRAICIVGLERTKLLISISASQGKSIALNTPLEASAPGSVCLALEALHAPFSNPVFVAIETSDSKSLQLIYYELDQGLNHVIRRKSMCSRFIDATASHLVPLPASIGGGVLVCCESWIMYDLPNFSGHAATQSQQAPHYLPLPSYKGCPQRVVAHALHPLKKDAFLLLLHCESGDVFKVSANYNKDQANLVSLSISLFASVAASTAIHIFKSGFFFANAWSSAPCLYQIDDLGNEQGASGTSTFSSVDFLSSEDAQSEGRKAHAANVNLLTLTHSLDSNAPMLDLVTVPIDYQESSASHQTPDMLLLCSNQLKRASRGTKASTLVESPIPLIPTSIYTCKLRSASSGHDYLVLTSTQPPKTLVLSIGETVEEVTDSCFVLDQFTLAVQQVGVSSVAQIYSSGIRHVRQASTNPTTDWFTPAGIRIVAAATSTDQIIIALSNDEVCYFEVDPNDDQLVEYQDRLTAPAPVTSIALWKMGLKKSPFMAMGCSDNTISIISLLPHNCLEILSLQALSAVPTSLLILSLLLKLSTDSSPVVHIGMESGLYVRTSLSQTTGELSSDTRTQYLGAESVKIFEIFNPVAGADVETSAIIALSSRPYLGFDRDNNQFVLSPLLGASIHGCVAPLSSEDVGGNALVALTTEGKLGILTIGNDDDDEDSEFDPMREFSYETVSLEIPGRKMIAEQNLVYVAEYDAAHDSLSQPLRNSKEKATALTGTQDSGSASPPLTIAPRQDDEASLLSCIEVIDYTTMKAIQKVALGSGGIPLSMAIIQFESRPSDKMLVVGCTSLSTTSSAKHYILTFQMRNKKKEHTLVELHLTSVEEPPHALACFKGKLLVGMGPFLRLYDIGMRQLLRKASTRIERFSRITKVAYCGHFRLAVTDICRGVSFVKYDTDDNNFVLFADDCSQRSQITTLASLDYETVVAGDKWGNFCCLRVPRNVSTLTDYDWALAKTQDSFLNGSPNRACPVCEHYVGDAVMGVAIRDKQAASPAIIYGELQGLISCFVPLSTKQEADYFFKLQRLMESLSNYDFDDFNRDAHIPNLLGRDHVKFRGLYTPSKNVIDGDFVSMFSSLRPAVKAKIAAAMNRSPVQIEGRIEDRYSNVVRP